MQICGVILPCISMAGQMKGMRNADTQSSLLWEIERLIEQKKK